MTTPYLCPLCPDCTIASHRAALAAAALPTLGDVRDWQNDIREIVIAASRAGVVDLNPFCVVCGAWMTGGSEWETCCFVCTSRSNRWHAYDIRSPRLIGTYLRTQVEWRTRREAVAS